MPNPPVPAPGVHAEVAHDLAVLGEGAGQARHVQDFQRACAWIAGAGLHGDPAGLSMARAPMPRASSAGEHQAGRPGASDQDLTIAGAGKLTNPATLA